MKPTRINDPVLTLQACLKSRQKTTQQTDQYVLYAILGKKNVIYAIK